MRLQKYLNEATEIPLDEFNELIHRECKPYLKLTKGKYMFKRGLYTPGSHIGKKKVRQNRRPRSMDPDIFSGLNKGLDKNGHVRRDKAVIAINIKEGAVSQFGAVHWIFPIGKFDYTGLMAKDMNISDGNTGGDPLTVMGYFGGEYVDDIKGNFEDYFTTNRDIKTAHREGYEIWFNCKEYYHITAKKYEGNIDTHTMRTKD